ncbi:MAG: 23S rRNA (pseudouridine(1915)-N(3))-methyltransferase RlmH [Rhodobacteraceae bacterium]|nr:23S rRNA (pseudouridine(1915)-N(3))-methyltransferase RlmH [Paracoccaceae bacterium]
MRITICAVGRLRKGPAATLLDDYLTRFDRTGRGLGLSFAKLREVEPKPATPPVEAEALLRQAPEGAVQLALDERGRALTSPEFATLLARWRDAGDRDLAIYIGGADGLDPGLRDSCRERLSFGPMVWPHMLARVMLAEQLYRAATILSGSPYHRA